ncbi:MAG TPA: helix-hairpin-helix domain-containing protein [Spirochaetes bacterium]|nr:helix-hairpin-helix domain-containing protein [Spirochaetota bacterium]
MKLILLVMIPQLCLQAFEYRENSPAALFNQYCAIADPSPLGNLSNPSYLPFQQGFYLQGSYGKPYSLDELNAATARTGYSHGIVGLQAGWTSFGMEEYREQTIEGSMGMKVSRFFSLGAGYTAFNLRTDTGQWAMNSWTSNARTAVALTPHRALNLSFSQENIISLFNDRRRDLLYPGWSAGCDLSPLEGLHLIWNLNRGYYGFENLFSVSVNLLSFLAVRVGYAREATVSSMALVFFHKNIRVAYGMRYHGILGTTHGVEVTLAGGGLGLSPLRFKRPSRDEAVRDLPDEPVDISRCTPEDLLELPGVSEDIARRIILYRDTIGPVTPKALYQVGLEEQQVQVLRQCLTGLAPDPEGFSRERHKKNRGRSPAKPGYDSSLRKVLFSRLIKEGVPAGTAIRVADMARTNRLNTLIPAIRGMKDLPPPLREKVVSVCADTLR